MKKLITFSLVALFFSVVQAQESVTFRVDMNQVGSISSNGVHVAGDWQSEANGGDDWQPGANMMDDGDADGIYELTVQVPAGDYQFKFINGNDWSEQPENVEGGCAAFTNRLLTVPVGGVSLDPVCFGSCDPCPIVGSDINLTLQVDVSQLPSVDANGISVGGTFNGFSPQPMVDQGGGIWSLEVPVASGSTVLWKYINGQDFGNNTSIESVPGECGQDDGAGGNNRVLTAPEEDTVLPAVCYSSCSECVEPGENYNLTLQVDVSELAEINAAGIHVAGNFNGFSPQPMTDQGDGVWSATVSVEEGTTALWKYINGPTFGDEVESVPSDCGQDDGFGGFNRDFLMPSEDTTLDVVCFGQCVACESAPEDYMLTLIVDASQLAEIAVEGIHVAGSFNGFGPEPMTDEGGGQYSYTTMVAEGSTVLWKYINGTTFGDEVESVPEECGQGDGFGGFNRVLVMPSNDATNGPVCFGSCEACSPVCENPFPAVDDASLSSEFDGTTIVLSWDPVPGSTVCQVQGRPEGAPYADRQQAKVFGDEPSSIALPPAILNTSTTYEWRVRCGCSIQPTVAGPWSAIATFTTPGLPEITSNPNPTEGLSNVSFNAVKTGYTTLEVYDLSGRSIAVVYSGVAQSGNDYRFEFDGSHLPNGIYLYRLTTAEEVINEKFMISR